MNEAKSPQPTPAHTPGPWELDDLGNVCSQAVHNIALVFSSSTREGWSGSDFDTQAHCEANARLIAAAPDLLAALQSARDCIELDRSALEVTHMDPLTNEVDADGAAGIAEYDAVLAQIGVAIAKATGAQA